MTSKPAFWRRTPPALFPSLLGLFGLGLAWRHAGGKWLAADHLVELGLGSVSMIYLFALVSYVAKLMLRPRVLTEDFRTVPGPAGLSAMLLSAMLLAAVLTPYAPALASVVLLVALGCHLALSLFMISGLVGRPMAEWRVTPAWHLVFVGFIVGAAPAVGLGMAPLAHVILAVTIGSATAIYAVSLGQLRRGDPPAPLRPMLAIHLSPASLFAGAAYLLGMHRMATGFGIVACLIFVVLLVRVRYLTAAGFSPLWGSFTFPLAAFSAAMLMLAEDSAVFRAAGLLALAGATLIIPWIAMRVLRVWATGALAEQTGAAIA